MLITDQRLQNQRITRPGRSGPAKMVAWLGAVQAQEYGPAKWSLGLRLPGATEAALDRALDQGRILRTHVLRPTWHFAVGKRAPLFTGDYVTSTRHATYDVHPDGRRFVFVTGDRTETTDLILVQNLFP